MHLNIFFLSLNTLLGLFKAFSRDIPLNLQEFLVYFEKGLCLLACQKTTLAEFEVRSRKNDVG